MKNETIKLKVSSISAVIDVVNNASIIVIESHEETGVEWGISFDGYNPSPENYFKMADKETAFRLSEYLNPQP